MLRNILCVAGLGLLFLVGKAAGGSLDGGWRLKIEGHQTFVFGESGFGGGIRIPWEVVIEFKVEHGRYLIGSGSARLSGPSAPLSRPGGWFDCRLVKGSYLDSNLVMHETPRVRFAGFPVAGQVVDGRVQLEPGYGSPGNYLAVTYECASAHTTADNWFTVAERGKQVMGKRQDAETRNDGDVQVARVREVGSLPPESRLDLPLQDGWTFSQGSYDDTSLVKYDLRRLK